MTPPMQSNQQPEPSASEATPVEKLAWQVLTLPLQPMRYKVAAELIAAHVAAATAAARAAFAQCEEKLAKAEATIQTCNLDWAEDDTAIKGFAARFGIDVDGDRYGVPSMVDVVEKMAEQLTDLTAAHAKALEDVKRLDEALQRVCLTLDAHENESSPKWLRSLNARVRRAATAAGPAAGGRQ